jgi:hypothetical protein
LKSNGNNDKSFNESMKSTEKETREEGENRKKEGK